MAYYHADRSRKQAASEPPAGALTETQAARYLGIAPRSLWTLRKSGRGPAHVRINERSIRYPLRLLDRWLEEHAAPPSSIEEGGVA
jgi:predicted DNA-binding transcriptional regulator AlpA